MRPQKMTCSIRSSQYPLRLRGDAFCNHCTSDSWRDIGVLNADNTSNSEFGQINIGLMKILLIHSVLVVFNPLRLFHGMFDVVARASCRCSILGN